MRLFSVQAKAPGGGLIDKHAGWRSANSKNRYIKYSKEELLSVSKRLGI